MRSLYSNLVDYWPLYNLSSTRDSVTGQNNMSHSAEGVDAADGKVIKAARFTAANAAALRHADAAALSTGDIDFSWCCWVKLRSLAGGATYYLISKDNNSGTGREYHLRWSEGTPDVFVFSVFKSGPTAVAATSTVTPVLNQWHFICCGHDAAANIAWIEVDGTYVSQATAGALQAEGSALLYFGARSDGADYATADMCEVGFWKRVLTPAERWWLYNNGRGRTYPFDGRPNTERAAARLRRNRMTGLVG